MTARIRKGDEVILLKGKDKGKRGNVIKVLPDENRVIVSGLNLAVHHDKPTQSKDGGRLSREAAIHVSNVSLFDKNTLKPLRTGFKVCTKVLSDDKVKVYRVRYFKKTGEVVNG